MTPLTYRRILSLYLPLAASWLLMSVESPIALAIIGRTPGAETATAAFLVVMMVALWIESPVIDLLSTATTLGKSAQSIEVIHRFAIACCLWTGALHALVATTPIYDWVTLSVLNLPREVADAARWPLILMIPWSPAIGWRRWRQGIMIRHGETRAITLGTITRLLTILTAGFALLHFTELPGIQVAAIALSLSVLVEAQMVHVLSKRALDATRSVSNQDDHLSMGQIWKFHWPMTLATLFTLTTTPVVGALLAQSKDPVLQMAGWQMAASVAFVFRTVTYALPELVIALGNGPSAARVLRTFCIGTGVVMSLVMVVLSVSGLAYEFFLSPLQATPTIATVSNAAFLACVALPLFGAMISYVRGRLTWARITIPRIWGIVAGFIVLFVTMRVTLALGWQGVYCAALGLSMGHFADLLVQALWWQRVRGTVTPGQIG